MPRQDTPIRYIKGGIGVLFVLHCSLSASADTGENHMGAVLKPVSQYPLEEEILVARTGFV